MRELNPSDRVQPRTVAQLLPPGCCAMCGNGTNLKGYIDPSIFYEWEGQVYFCWNCTVEMGETIGMLSPAESEFLINQNKEMAAKMAVMEEELNAIKPLRDYLASLPVSVSSGSDPVIDAPEGESGEQEDVTEESPNDGEPANDASPTGEGTEPVVAKPVKKRRPNDASLPPSGNRNSNESFLL